MTPSALSLPPATLDLSVVLINWQMRYHLERCLPTIAAQHPRCRYEILVVNKPSDDGTPEWLRAKYPEARLISHPVFGFAEMRNVGIRNSRGRVILMLDADTEILDGCFDAIVDFFRRYPKVGGAGGYTLRTDGSIEYNVKRFYDLTTILVRRSPLMRWWPDNPWNHRHLMMDKDHERPFLGDWMAGACFAIRRETLRQVGLFDTSMHYFEDVDWCWRAKWSGWKIAFIPRARIIHLVQRKSAQGFNREAMIHLKSALRFWRKTLPWNRPPRRGLPTTQDRDPRSL